MTARVANLSALLPSGQVTEVPPVVLCSECAGDWCPACDWTGLALPADDARRAA